MRLESKKHMKEIQQAAERVVDDRVVWDVIQRYLPILLREAEELLEES